MPNLPNADTRAYRLGSAALFFGLAIIAGALAIEHIGGIKPCPLCLEQRWAYYAGIPLLFLALVLHATDKPRSAGFLFLAVALMCLANAGLGVYHAGAEWKFWPGPETCTGAVAVTNSAGNLLRNLGQSTVVRCDEAAIRIAGLSLAGWNAVASLMLSTASLKAAFATGEHERYL